MAAAEAFVVQLVAYTRQGWHLDAVNAAIDFEPGRDIMTAQTKCENNLRANFPQGAPIPELLARLCVFENGRREPYGCDFNMGSLGAHGREDLAIWFGENLQAMDQLAPIGCTSDGSMFALWLLPKQQVDAQPVVVLGSAGERAVVAENLSAFIELMCNCVEFVPEAANSNNFEMLHAEPDRLSFVKWARESCGVVAYRSAEDVIRRAQLAYPGFAQWVDDECVKT